MLKTWKLDLGSQWFDVCNDPVTLGTAIASTFATAAGGTAAAAGTAAAGTGLSLGTALSALSTIATVGGTIAAGQSAKEAAKAEAAQMEKAATAERADASKRAAEQRRKTALLTSEQRALAAASGGGTINPTILDIMDETQSYGDYKARSEVWAGEDRANGYLDKASAARAHGKAKSTGSWLEAISEGATGAAEFRKLRLAGY